METIQIRDPGWKKVGSGIGIPDPQHWCHAANSKIAIDSLPTLQISVGIIALFGKIYDEEPILIVFSNIGKEMWKVCRSPTLCCYLQTFIECKWHKQAPLSSFRPTKGWVLHWLLWKSQQQQLKGRPIECYHFQPNSFLIGRNLLDWNLVEGKKRHLLHVW